MIKRVLAAAILQHQNLNKCNQGKRVKWKNGKLFNFLKLEANFPFYPFSIFPYLHQGVLKGRIPLTILLLIFFLVQPLNLSSEPTKSNPPFGVGERMVFAIRAFGITAGHATLEIKEIINLDGHEVYHIVVIAQTTPFFSLFYRINDRLETYLDIKEIYPHRYEAHLEEGKYRKNEVIIYDQERHIAYRKGDKINPIRSKSPDLPAEASAQAGATASNKYRRTSNGVKIPPRVQDPVSTYYYLRTLNLKTGEVIEVPINCGRHNYLLTLKVKGEERIHTKGGYHQAFILVPQSLTLEGETKRKGQATAYLSVTEKTLLLAKVSRAGIFSARAVLIEWTP
jgi:hypothetical protein